MPEALQRLAQIPSGARGRTGQHPPEFAGASAPSSRDTVSNPPASRCVRGAGQPRRLARRQAPQSRAVSLNKMPRLRWRRAGRGRPREIVLTELQKIAIMGKGHPVIPRWSSRWPPSDRERRAIPRRDAGNFEIRDLPMLARSAGVDPSLTSATRLLATGVDGIEADARWRAARRNTLANATDSTLIGTTRQLSSSKSGGFGPASREVAKDHGVSDEALDEAVDLHAWRATPHRSIS